ncbi:MAG TPA: ATP-grasp domain-containing protein [Candidatus Acidoferrum sp.]|nr:ATP-grasp domain-containing protein [Candidatus Acidoferrum sp.]
MTTSLVSQSEGKKILVIGFNARHVVCSAKRAGYNVTTISHFSDCDLVKCGNRTLVIHQEFTGFLQDLDYKVVRDAIKGIEYDSAVLASGFEALEIPGILGNDPKVANFINNKKATHDKLESLGYRVPKHFELEDNIKYPVIVKPQTGAGGFKNALVRDSNQLDDVVSSFHENEWHDFIIEEYIKGLDASSSILSTGRLAITIAVNEQLLGLRNLGPTKRFSFCGSVTPLKTIFTGEIEAVSESIAIDFGLIGSNGIDFIIGPDGPVVIEVNPRFQGTLDTVEAALGINVFDAHVKACSNELIQRPKYRRFATRVIYFAERDLEISKRISQAFYMDIPCKGTHIQRGKPVISAMGCGKSRDIAFNAAMRRIEAARKIYGA